MLTLLIAIPLFILIIILVPYLNSFKKYGVVELEALKTHSNRTVQFTKGNRYLFYKNDDRLILNQDDTGPRDNFNFSLGDVTKYFKTTDRYGSFVLKQIK